MIIARQNNRGIDDQINKIQDYLNTKLNWDNIQVYGRLSEVEKEAGNVLTWSDGTEYPEIFHDDRYTATIGFRVLEKTVSDNMFASVDIIFTVNQKQVHGSDNFEDERVLLEIHNLLDRCIHIQSITGIKERNANVFSGLNTDAIRYNDMFPFQVFAYTVTIAYDNTLSPYD